jgi:hypothetical protein
MTGNDWILAIPGAAVSALLMWLHLRLESTVLRLQDRISELEKERRP